MEVSYRSADRNDLQLFFDWTNDPEVRSNSFNSSPVILADHTEWYLRKIKDHNTIFYVAEAENCPIGMVRFDIKEQNTIVSILIDKAFRGKGLASVVLTDCCRFYFQTKSKPVEAYIKISNAASIHSFQKAGFTFLRNESVNDVDSVIFIKEKEND